MTTEGAMHIHSTAAQSDTENSRYLAEAAFHLAKWNNEKTGCKDKRDLASTNLPGTALASVGTVAATVYGNDRKFLNIDAVGETNNGAKFQIVRTNIPRYDLKKLRTVTLSSDSDSDVTNADTFIDNTSQNANKNKEQYIELTQSQSRGLMKFSLEKIPSQARIIKAELQLYQYQSPVTQPAPVSVRRILRTWNAESVTWIYASWSSILSNTRWTSQGADFSSVVANTVVNGVGSYKWDITNLVTGWMSETFPNNGLLLQPDGPLQASRFASFENKNNKPVVTVIYASRCTGEEDD